MQFFYIIWNRNHKHRPKRENAFRQHIVTRICCYRWVELTTMQLCRKTRSLADADKPARRVWRSLKVTKHISIPYARYSFPLCNSNFVFKTRRFLRYSTSKNVVTLKWGQRSLTVIESGIIRYMVYGFLLAFFSNFVPKMHRFWDIRLQDCRDLENRVGGPSRSL